MMSRLIVFVALASMFASAFAQMNVPENVFIQAQKLYAQGRFAEAATAFGPAYPLEAARARLQIADTAQVNAAGRSLDSLLLRTEPEDSVYAQILLLRTNAFLRQGNFQQAARSWRQASDFSRPGIALETAQLCEDIATQSAELPAASCDAVKNRDRALLPSPLPKHTMVTPVAQTAAAPVAPVAAAPATAPAAAPVAATPVAAAPAPKAPVSTGFVLRLGVFGVKANAEGLIQKFSGKVPLALEARADGKFAVITGVFHSKADALTFGEQTLRPLGQDFIALPANSGL